MSGWLRWILGLEEGEVPAGSDARWELSGLPQGTLLIASALIAVACIALIVLLYRSERTLRPAQKVALAALRVAALVLIILVLLNPRLLTEIHFTRPGKTLLLFDTSASMGQRDPLLGDERLVARRATGLEPTGLTRAELALAAIKRQDFLERLAEKNRLEVYGFAETVSPVPALEAIDDVTPSGSETRVGEAVHEVSRGSARDPVAAMIVVSDGRTTGGKSPGEAGKELGLQRRLPVYAIGVGRMDVPRNCAVRELEAPKVVEVGFPLEIEATIALSGFREPARVKLVRTSGPGTEDVVDERIVDPRSSRFEARMKFLDTLPEKGIYRYEVEIEERPGETSHRDNRRDIFVRASEEEYRVLIVSGVGSFEFQYLSGYTIRDDGILVSCWQTNADRRRLQEGDVPIDAMPETVQQLREYDVVVLMDPEPEFVTPVFQKGLSDFVSELGGGLVYVAGESHTPVIASRGDFRRLRALLPVDLLGSRRQARVHDTAWRPRLTAVGESHPICRLIDDPDYNRRLWGRLPPFYFAHDAGKLRPAAVSLLVSEDEVIAAVQRVGLGETVYLATDGFFYRWSAAAETYPERFWAGIIRYLALGKRQAGSRKVSIETDRDLYHEGEPVRITVQQSEAPGRSPAASNVEVVVERLDAPGGKEKGGGRAGEGGAMARDGNRAAEDAEKWILALAPAGSEEGRFSGHFRPPEPGHYRVRIEPRGEASFEVQALTSEWEDPSPDFTTLEELAAGSGGRRVPLDGLASLAEEIPDASVREILGRRATTVWDSAFLMILFSVLLGLEWLLRKLWRLN